MKKMKFLLAAIIVIVMSNMAMSQVWNPNTNLTDDIAREGNTSIGSTSTAFSSSGLTKFKVFARTYQNMGPTSGTAGEFTIANAMAGSPPSETYKVSLGSIQGYNGAYMLNCLYTNSSGSNTTFSVLPNGKTTIGSLNGTDLLLVVKGKAQIGNVISTSNDYKLFVETGILTEKLKVAVKTTGNWSDYVFDKDYKLLSLGEVESYINKNKHLPGVPSAEEVVKDGIDMATMDAKLLEKIEELTLYMIQLKKQNEQLSQNNQVLTEQFKILSERIESLQK